MLQKILLIDDYSEIHDPELLSHGGLRASRVIRLLAQSADRGSGVADGHAGARRFDGVRMDLSV